jgi:predicted nucleic acid-binding Zn ribbon protein
MSDEDLNAAIASVASEATEELGGIPVPDNPAPEPEPVVATPEPEPAADPEPTPEPTPEPDPASEPEPEPADPDVDEPLRLTAEQLKVINDNPDTLGVAHKLMQSGLTKRFQEVANERTAQKDAIDTAYWIRDNPELALEDLAKRTGRTLIPKDGVVDEPGRSESTDETVKAWAEKIGPKSAELLKPLVEDLVKSITSDLVSNQIAPLQASDQARTEATAAANIDATTRSFHADIMAKKLPWSSEIEKGMAEKITQLNPAPGTSLNDYLTTIYNDVSYRANALNGRRAEVARLKAARNSAEPVKPIRPVTSAKARITSDMTDDQAFAAAVAEAEAEAALS